MENIILQLIVGGVTIIGSILAVTLVLAKKLKASNVPAQPAPPSNGHKAFQENIQHQVDQGEKNLLVIEGRFNSQVITCNERWLEQAKAFGRVEAYMVEIRDRLTKLECGS